MMKIPPGVVLFFLAPAVAELLSGSAPPAEFFNPISFLLLASLYGSGALVVRELKLRWKKGYVSMFVLGAAFGIIEEGLMVKSFFDPKWMDLGFLGVYGRWQEVNWVWSEWLIIYHAIFSIAIPITLVELAYSERRNESWVGTKSLTGLLVLLGAVTVFGYTLLTPYRPPPIQYFLTAVMVVILAFVAWRIPSNAGRNGKHQILSTFRLTLIGFLTAVAFFLFFGAGPYIISEPLILMVLGVGLVFLVFAFLKRYDWDERTLPNKFSLTAGALSFMIALTPLQELDMSRPDSTRGMFAVGAVALLMLILLKRKLRS